MHKRGWRKSKNFGESLEHAVRGLRVVWVSESNLRYELIAALSAVVVAFGLRVSTWEFLLLLIVILIVLCLELFNTALELSGDALMPRYNKKMKMAKDVAAGAVLLASFGALVVGLCIFLPRFMILFGLA